MTLLWPFHELSLTLSWTGLAIVMTLPWPCHELALTLTLPWPCLTLPLKFHQNRVSNSWDIDDIEFLWWVVGGLGWYAKSFSCLIQLKVTLGWVELWMSLGFDNKDVLGAINIIASWPPKCRLTGTPTAPLWLKAKQNRPKKPKFFFCLF